MSNHAFYRIPGLKTPPIVKNATHPTTARPSPAGVSVALVGAPAAGDIMQFNGTLFVPKKGEFAIAAFFTAAAQTLDVPMIDFAFTVIGWRARLGASGSATFTVKSAASVTAAYANMIGAGTAPAVSAALGASDDSLDWDIVAVAANEPIELGCPTLTTATQAALTLRCRRT